MDNDATVYVGARCVAPNILTSGFWFLARGTLSGYAARFVYRLSFSVLMDVPVVGVNQGAERIEQGEWCKRQKIRR